MVRYQLTGPETVNTDEMYSTQGYHVCENKLRGVSNEPT